MMSTEGKGANDSTWCLKMLHRDFADRDEPSWRRRLFFDH